MDAALSEYYYNEKLFQDDLLDFFDSLPSNFNSFKPCWPAIT